MSRKKRKIKLLYKEKKLNANLNKRFINIPHFYALIIIFLVARQNNLIRNTMT